MGGHTNQLPLAVELCGHPGSGKSTLAARLRAELDAIGLRVVLVHGLGRAAKDVRRRRLGQVVGLASAPATALQARRWLSSMGATGPRPLMSFGGIQYRRRNVLSAVRQLPRDEVALIDDGVLHGFYQITLLGSSVGGDLTPRLQDLLTAPVTISVRPAPDVAAAQYVLREKRGTTDGTLDALPSWHPLARMSLAEVREVYARQEAVLDLMEAVARSRSVVLRTQRTGEDDVNWLVAELMRMVGKGETILSPTNTTGRYR